MLGGEPKDIAGVGDSALWVFGKGGPHSSGQLNVFSKGTVYLIVTISGIADETAALEKAKILALKALGRLGRPVFVDTGCRAGGASQRRIRICKLKFLGKSWIIGRAFERPGSNAENKFRLEQRLLTPRTRAAKAQIWPLRAVPDSPMSAGREP